MSLAKQKAKSAVAATVTLLLAAFMLLPVVLMKILGENTISGAWSKLLSADLGQWGIFSVFFFVGLMLIGMGAFINARWPSKEPKRNAYYSDAVFSAVHTRWPKNDESVYGEEFPIDVDNSEVSQRVKRALSKLRQAAIDEEIIVWGCLNPNHISLKTLTHGGEIEYVAQTIVPPDHWHEYWVDISVIGGNRNFVATSRPSGSMFDKRSYCCLMVNKAQIEGFLWKAYSNEPRQIPQS